MVAGVTHSFFVVDVIVAVELFLVFRAWRVLLVALAVHGVGMLLSLREPRFLDLWLTPRAHLSAGVERKVNNKAFLHGPDRRIAVG